MGASLLRRSGEIVPSKRTRLRFKNITRAYNVPRESNSNPGLTDLEILGSDSTAVYQIREHGTKVHRSMNTVPRLNAGRTPDFTWVVRVARHLYVPRNPGVSVSVREELTLPLIGCRPQCCVRLVNKSSQWLLGPKSTNEKPDRGLPQGKEKRYHSFRVQVSAVEDKFCTTKNLFCLKEIQVTKIIIHVVSFLYTANRPKEEF